MIFLLLPLRLHRKDLLFQRRSLNGVRIPAPFPFGEKRSLITHASLETDGNDGSELEVPPLEGSAEVVSVENLPLESKLQMMLEQKRKMKLAKKIRLRRKRLLRKRRMRKKGRWPPSKMKKNKNV
ncbi:50S ribosomal protein 5 alpha, chloroplastic [Cocos nucifera]|uniref:50S ribosomal protein 5 alpha, chloroplastic n=1 Tax=Cocos nucifera TaxID=13894 RepID=A0A8K0MV47_COCNU|nr:50S ribosomal protein 5 alpha, chloroplastic [Cocos nucifera]